MKRLVVCMALAICSFSVSAQVENSEKYLKYRWKNVPASAYIQYAKTGNAALFNGLVENIAALNALIEAEAAEKQGKYIYQIINGVYYFSNMPAWVNPVVDDMKGNVIPDPGKPLVTSTSAEISSTISLALQLFETQFNEIDPMIATTARRAMKTKNGIIENSEMTKQ